MNSFEKNSTNIKILLLILSLGGLLNFSLEVAKIALFNKTNGELNLSPMDYVYLTALILGVSGYWCCHVTESDGNYNSYRSCYLYIIELSVKISVEDRYSSVRVCCNVKLLVHKLPVPDEFLATSTTITQGALRNAFKITDKGQKETFEDIQTSLDKVMDKKIDEIKRSMDEKDKKIYEMIEEMNKSINEIKKNQSKDEILCEN
ncbi:hypothetical protein C1645_805728 [Glomus cerebriforme]|uniref:Uncharacterized protein n=1 Tax=Glomus cerebriforme TaxID=658196 RepID=A0A397T5X3_9GLOM|nr:hypothetical protein C1645_805728 [Glomus cerebriforme]